MADDAELSAIRQKRLQEMQSLQEGSFPPLSADAFGIQDGRKEEMVKAKGNQTRNEEMMEQQKAMFNSVLNQVLDQQARARLNTIMVAKPDKGRQIESMILSMAQRGQIGGRLSENDLVGLVERLNAQTQKRTTIKFDRRRAALDSDSDD